jgi:hypothetical protein
MPFFTNDELNQATTIAEQNWADWHENFMFEDEDKSRIPVLADRFQFCYFCRAYYVLQKYSLDQVETIRVSLFNHDSYRVALEDPNGTGLDILSAQLKQDLAIKNERSFLSKLAAFSKPDVFMALDKYAGNGAHFISGLPLDHLVPPLRSPRPRNRPHPYQSYAQYLGAVNGLLNGPAGNEIRNYIGNDLRGDAFYRRVLDCCLMIIGNRWP